MAASATNRASSAGASDHGKTGVAGDGAAIKCEDNNGWRWEPV
jgi:hypothetical protein